MDPLGPHFKGSSKPQKAASRPPFGRLPQRHRPLHLRWPLHAPRLPIAEVRPAREDALRLVVRVDARGAGAAEEIPHAISCNLMDLYAFSCIFQSLSCISAALRKLSAPESEFRTPDRDASAPPRSPRRPRDHSRHSFRPPRIPSRSSASDSPPPPHLWRLLNRVRFDKSHSKQLLAVKKCLLWPRMRTISRCRTGRLRSEEKKGAVPPSTCRRRPWNHGLAEDEGLVKLKRHGNRALQPAKAPYQPSCNSPARLRNAADVPPVAPVRPYTCHGRLGGGQCHLSELRKGAP